MAHDPQGTTDRINRGKVDFEFLRNKLKLKNLETQKKFSEKYPHVEKFFYEKGIQLAKIRDYSARLLGTGTLAGTLLFSPPAGIKSLPAPKQIIEKVKELGKATPVISPQKVLVDSLAGILPDTTRPLTRDEEKSLEQLFSNTLGVKAKGTLEGEHLNTTYGLIGAEQHLARYPGDNIYTHPTIPVNDEGMAPGLGAWGYFSSSKDKLTPDLVEKEKWYAVVQTLYLPDWNKRLPYLRDWYKYRKVLIVNTKNGNAVVAAIADSGPAAWTGKQFGGSPEVMDYLGGPTYKKGAVVLFFVDDPQNKVPLGPVDYNKQSLLVSSKLSLPESVLKQI